MRCWFGEKHPDTGNETWKVDICLDNEDHCYQLVSKDGYEMRECWDLKYEDEEYAGSGCYSGKHCHHEHCWDEVTVCICDSPECNDWSPQVSVISGQCTMGICGGRLFLVQKKQAVLYGVLSLYNQVERDLDI